MTSFEIKIGKGEFFMKSKVGVRLIHGYVKNYQILSSKLGVRLIHRCVLYLSDYGKMWAWRTSCSILVAYKGTNFWQISFFDCVLWLNQQFPSLMPLWVTFAGDISGGGGTSWLVTWLAVEGGKQKSCQAWTMVCSNFTSCGPWQAQLGWVSLSLCLSLSLSLSLSLAGWYVCLSKDTILTSNPHPDPLPLSWCLFCSMLELLLLIGRARRKSGRPYGVMYVSTGGLPYPRPHPETPQPRALGFYADEAYIVCLVVRSRWSFHETVFWLSGCEWVPTEVCLGSFQEECIISTKRRTVRCSSWNSVHAHGYSFLAMVQVISQWRNE